MALFAILFFLYNTISFYKKTKQKTSEIQNYFKHSAIKIKLQNVFKKIKTYGIVESYNNVDVFSESSGYITNILVQKYQFVKKNQKIIEINDYINENINIESNDQDIDVDLDKNYIKNNKNIQFNNKKNRSKKYAISPFDGYISEIYQEIGSNISRNKLFSIVDSNKLKISASLSMDNIKFIKNGMFVDIITNNKNYKSKITSVSKILNKNGSVNIEITVPKEIVKNVFIGENIDIEIPIEKKNVAKIPSSSVSIDKNNDICIFAIKDINKNIAECKKIQIIDEEGENFIINGLKNDDVIITSGVNLIKNNYDLKYEILYKN